MRTFIKPTQDATLYERYPSLNSGLDEIIEIGKVIKTGDGSAMYATASTRIVLDFDIPSSQQYHPSASYYLNLRIANANNVNRYQKLEVYPVSRSWTEGSGYSYQDVINNQDGVSWESASNATPWVELGGDIVTSISASYTFTKVPLDDVKIDVTSLIRPVVNNTNWYEWNGLLIKLPDLDEIDANNVGNVKFFSVNTSTIFSPTLEIVWNNQTFVTGSLKRITNGNVSIIPKNLKESYTTGEIDKVYLVVRDPFPDKRFDAVQRYRTVYYLPSESYFRIRDAVSNVTIHDFDQYSSINCDSSGSYFILDTTGLEINRYYSLDLKVKSDSLVFYPEFNYTFKVDTDV
jgi:hypothetical protein